MVDYDRVYHNDEDESEFDIRFSIFKDNVDIIDQHNQNPESTFELRMNQFGDLTNEEYYGLVTGGKTFKYNNWIPNDDFESSSTSIGFPKSWDWRDYDAVTPIENQGTCGSSPFFAAAATIEGCHSITTGSLVAVSVQQMIDCPANTPNIGCEGGEMTWSYEAIMDEKGIETNSCYPYTGESSNCSYNVNSPCCASTIGGYINVTSNEYALQKAVLLCPVATVISLPTSFQFYSKGVYNDPSCSNSTADAVHGIAVIGYGVSNGIDYWILKNSFGTSWGIEGYMWLAKGDHNLCGIANYPTYPTNCQNC